MTHPRRTRRRVMTGLASAAAVTLLLTACGGGEDGGNEDGPVELRMTTWSANEDHLAILNQIADAYIEENPDKVSSVSFEPLTGSGYINALTTQIAGGDVPDMAWILEAYAPQFVDAGVLYDIGPALQAESEGNVDDLLPGAMELWTEGEAIYAYPFSNSPLGIYANLDLIEAAGQPSPRDLLAEGDWTWDRLMEIGAAVHDAGQNGYTTAAFGDWRQGLGTMWQGWGAAPWSEDGTTCTLNSPEMVEFADWFHSQVFDTGAIVGPGESADFFNGDVAFTAAQLSSSGRIGDAFAWDFLPMPAGPAGAAPVVGQAGVGVLSQSEHPEAAAEFLAYFTNAENAALLGQFFPPPRESVLTLETMSAAAPALTEEQIQETVIDQALAGVTLEGHVRMSEIADLARAQFDALWTAEGDAQTVLDAVCERIDPVLSGS